MLDRYTDAAGAMRTPRYADERVTLWHADCLDVLRAMPDESVHAVVCDPPYGLADHPVRDIVGALTAWLSGDREHVPDGKGGFMGRDWDRFVPPPAVWDECYRVLKPGGHLLAFAGSRTDDLMGIAIRLAGFEIRDGISWLYGQGFPKSHDISKAIDKAAGAEREVIGKGTNYDAKVRHGGTWTGASYAQDPYTGADGPLLTAPATDDARRWVGWGTALKPAQEPIVVARKPLASTVAGNVLVHGTGALNIDGCRVEGEPWTFTHGPKTGRTGGGLMGEPLAREGVATSHPAGRWPSNVVFTHAPDCVEGGCVSGCPVAELDHQSGVSKDGVAVRSNVPTGLGDGAIYGTAAGRTMPNLGYGGQGGASRFFPTFRRQAKAAAGERPAYERAGEVNLLNWGTRKRCVTCGRQEVNVPGSECQCAEPVWAADPAMQNVVAHETVKPLELMRWLVRLVTPPQENVAERVTVLEPFGGSGTTAEACILEGVHCVVIEREAKYLPLIEARVRPYRSPQVLARALGHGVRPRRRPPKPGPPAGEALFDLGT